MLQLGSGRAVEDFVQGAKEIVHGTRLGKPGRIPQVAKPDNRVYRFSFPTLRAARQNALASARAETGLQ